MMGERAPDWAQASVTREDIERLASQIAELREAVERHEASLRMGLTRMGQLQAELDLVRSAWSSSGTGASLPGPGKAL